MYFLCEMSVKHHINLVSHILAWLIFSTKIDQPFGHLCPSMSFSGKNFEKNFFLRFSWKVPYNLWYLYFDMENSKINSFFQIFSSPSLFLPRLVKNVLKMGQNFLFTDFHEKFHLTLFWYGELKNQALFPIFVYLHIHFCFD